VKLLFQIGDKIIYPMQGAGIIQGIEQKEVSGVTEAYFKINIFSNRMQIMIPLGKILNTGIRPIGDESAIENILMGFNEKILYSGEALSYRERYQMNMLKVKTGKLKEGSEVVHDLMLIGKNKPLNSSEKQLLMTAKKILVSEIALVKGIPEESAEELLTLYF